jgi:hypothetical protein
MFDSKNDEQTGIQMLKESDLEDGAVESNTNIDDMVT